MSPLSRRALLGVVAILAVMLTIEITTALQESPTNDEAVHLSAGLSYWRTGDFRLNPEHPPLIKLWAALPLVFTPVTLPLDDQSWRDIDQWKFGEKFLYENRWSPETILFLGRLPIMLLSLLLGWWIFQASRALFGTAGGFLSLGLYALDPNIIAHSRYVTTDLGFSAFVLLTLLMLIRLWRTPTRRNLIWFTVVLWAMVLTKFSSLAFLVVLALLLVVMKFLDRRHPVVQWRNIWRWLVIALPLSLLATWAVYGFDVRRPIDDPRVQQLYQQRQDVLQRGVLKNYGPLERFVVGDLGDPTTPAGRLAVRLEKVRYPMYTFFRGAITVIGHSRAGQTAFLHGEWRETGWWYYFPAAFFAKIPLPTLIAFGLVIVMFIRILMSAHRREGSWSAGARSIDERWYFFGVPPLLFLLISLGSHLNLGWRHIMPIYPPLLILAGSIATMRWSRLRMFIPALLLAGAVMTQALTYPNEIGYFSPLIGGNANGYRWLGDSNLDWGQDLPKLRRYLREHNVTSVQMAFYGMARFQYYIPQAVSLPNTSQVATQGRPTGWAAISLERLYSADGSYSWLQAERPVVKLGSSLYVYHW